VMILADRHRSRRRIEGQALERINQRFLVRLAGLFDRRLQRQQRRCSSSKASSPLANVRALRFIATPQHEGGRSWYTFEGTGRLEPVMSGLLPTLTGSEGTRLRQWWPQRDPHIGLVVPFEGLALAA
jgi:hypothetical protein